MVSWLLYNTLCAVPLVIVGMLLRRLGWMSPRLEHLFWLSVLVRLVFPPLAFLDRAVATTSTGIIASQATTGDEWVAWMTRNFGNNWSFELQRLGIFVFTVAVLYIGYRELRRVWQVERCLREASRASDDLRARVEETARKLSVQTPEVQTIGGAGPFLWCFRKPVLLLPEEEALEETVVAHELAHVQRRDHWSGWFELIVRLLHFWNPVFWYVRHRFLLSAELACDQWVLERFPRQRTRYANALVDALERAVDAARLPRHEQAALHAVGHSIAEFETRLSRILSAPPERIGLGLGLPLVLALGVLSLPGVAAPGLERFRAQLPSLPDGFDESAAQRLLERADRVLVQDPNNAAAYASRGLALVTLQRYDDALEAFREQERLGDEPAKALYNQACALALQGRLESAFEHLKKCQSAGFEARAYAGRDPDLSDLAKLPGFREWMEMEREDQ